jgi:ubiquitin-conjugating enzyme E2 Z
MLHELNDKYKNDKTERTNIIISKQTISRLIQDVKNIIKCPLTDHGIHYIHDEDDILKGYALIIGPEDTPYFGGNYFFELNYPVDYPFSPPNVKYCTNGDRIRFHPNFYTNGKVCVSILNTWRGEQWTSCQSISSILLTLCTLFCKDPLINEPGIKKCHVDFDNYTKVIEYKNIEIAILKMVNKTEFVFPKQFHIFDDIIMKTFLKNKDKILSIVDNKKKEAKQQITIHIYSMPSVVIDYSTLFEKCKVQIQNCEIV